MRASAETSRHSLRPPGTLRVLLIDDDPDDRLLIRDMLEDPDGKISCDAASTFESGIDALARHSYDACLVDYRLGARSGVDLIRQFAPDAACPMILLTGSGGSDVDDAALAAGAADYLVKDGLGADELRRSIRYAVGMWRARESAIVARAQAETARKQAVAGRVKYQSLFDGVPVGLFRTGPDGRIHEVNETAVGMLRYPDRAAVEGLNLGGLVVGGGSIVAGLSAMVAGHPVRDTDIEIRRADGGTLWVKLDARPIPADDGSIDRVEWAMSDISARKRAEREVALRGALLDQVSSAVIVTDMSGRCTFWNRHAETMYGWTEREAIGRPIAELTVPVEDRDVAAEILAGIADTGRWEGEFRVARKDGSTFLAHVSNSLLSGDDGTPTGVVGVSLDITAAREAEAELHRYQELITAAFDSSPVGKAVVSTPDGRIVSANQALGSLLGRDVGDLLGAHFADLTHPDDVDIDIAQFGELVEGSIDSYSIDKRYLTSDGRAVWGRLQASAIRDEEGNIRYGFGQVVDITETKIAEDRIRFQASLLDQVNHAVIATDLSGAVTYWNRYAEILYGRSADEVMGASVFDVTAPDADPEDLAAITQIIMERGTWEGEVIVARPDGSVLPAWASDTLITDDDGNPVGIVGIKVDLSEIKQAEELADSERALNRTLLESVNVPIAVIGPDGLILVSNPSWDELAGDDLGSDSYLPPCIEEHAHAGLVGGLTRGISEVLAERKNRYEVEYECHRRGAERWLRTVVIPTDDGGAVISHWDITDERIARAALEETLRAKDEFIASISHELRTPLTVVLGLAETLRTEHVTPDEAREFHGLLAEQAQEVAYLVEDLLVAGRIDSETLTLKSEHVDLASEVGAVINAWGRTGERHTMHVDVRDGLVARADPLRVRQIVRNLVTNAIRYGEAPIEISASADEDRVKLIVSDDGEGVPADAVKRMFQPYARFGAAEGQPLSVGLGLHVARRLARLMGGDLTYRRDDDSTVFELSLPV